MLVTIGYLMEQTYFNYNLNPNLSINDFFIGNSNIDAFNILIKEKVKNNQLLLIGPKKSGKTHLSIIWKEKFGAIKYNNNFNQIIDEKQNIIIDDLLDNINEEEIFHIINHCQLYNLKILITTSDYLNTYKFQLSDLSSRLKIFLKISINLPNDELLINLMVKLFHDKQIVIKNPEIFSYIIKRVNRSYDMIFDLIDKIDKLLLKKNKQLTIPIIKELI
tara:strand:+ start:556 stop:1212 length:657 start_codon:yes stop_codon:yes gene_type:complete